MANDLMEHFEETYKRVENTFARPLTERDKEVIRVAFQYGRTIGIDDVMQSEDYVSIYPPG